MSTLPVSALCGLRPFASVPTAATVSMMPRKRVLPAGAAISKFAHACRNCIDNSAVFRLDAIGEVTCCRRTAAEAEDIKQQGIDNKLTV
jgi:hypothetical protein